MSVHDIVKKYSKIQISLRVDSVTDEYILSIPEQIVNEMNWYEDTKLSWKTDGEEVIITESDE